VDNLIVKDDKKDDSMSKPAQDILSNVFESQIPKMGKIEFNININSMGEASQPVIVTRSEYMRRMKEMSSIQSGMSFYGEMPDMYNVILNSDHKLIQNVLVDATSACSENIKPFSEILEVSKNRASELKKAKEGKKAEEVPESDKNELDEVEKKILETESEIKRIYSDYASKNKVVHELIDLALLQNGMLKGEALNKFIKRSIELI